MAAAHIRGTGGEQDGDPEANAELAEEVPRVETPRLVRDLAIGRPEFRGKEMLKRNDVENGNALVGVEPNDQRIPRENAGDRPKEARPHRPKMVSAKMGGRQTKREEM
jgi:hypothetical protein